MTSHLQEWAESMAIEGRLKPALDAFSKLARVVPLNHEHLKQLTLAFYNTAVSNSSQHDQTQNQKVSSCSPFLCASCKSVPCDPVTLACGHTECRRCVQQQPQKRTHNGCARCGEKRVDADHPPRVNVLVSSLVSRIWPNECQAARLREKADALSAQGQWDQVEATLAEALKLTPHNHGLLDSRAHALHQMGCSERALDIAEEVVRAKPEWAKGYHRKATVLTSLGRYEEALVSYCQFLSLEGDAADVQLVRFEIGKVLQKLLSPITRQRSAIRPRYKSQEDEGKNSTASPRFTTFAGCRENHRLHRMVDRMTQEVDKVKRLKDAWDKFELPIESQTLEISELECTLCCRLLWQPVTTPCGHTYCRSCLERCLDHRAACPLCKSNLDKCLEDRRHSVTQFLVCLIKQLYPLEYEERHAIHLSELTFSSPAATTTVTSSSRHEVPIFVCTVGYPTIPCPLHVFEPRYRLMIRRSLEAGTQQFGMCLCLNEQEQKYADVGVILKIRDVQYFPDGRSIVKTVGTRRFRVLQRSVRDGYSTAVVDYLSDEPVALADQEELILLHEEVHRQTAIWFENLNAAVCQQVLTHFGSMPEVEKDWLHSCEGPSWLWWLLAILPLDPKVQVAVLTMTSLRRRLQTLHKILSYLNNRS